MNIMQIMKKELIQYFAMILQNSFAFLKDYSTFMNSLIEQFKNFMCFMVKLPNLG